MYFRRSQKYSLAGSCAYHERAFFMQSKFILQKLHPSSTLAQHVHTKLVSDITPKKILFYPFSSQTFFESTAIPAPNRPRLDLPPSKWGIKTYCFPSYLNKKFKDKESKPTNEIKKQSRTLLHENITNKSLFKKYSTKLISWTVSENSLNEFTRYTN